MASWIPGPIFFVIFILDDLLEFGDLVSGGLYTYTALQEVYDGKRYPGCNGMEFVLLTQSECEDGFTQAAWDHWWDGPCDADTQDGMFCDGSYSYCGTDPNVIGCSVYYVEAWYPWKSKYKAVPENCQEHFTHDCANVKKRLAYASVGAMVASVFSSTVFHHVFAGRRWDLVQRELGFQDDEATLKSERFRRRWLIVQNSLFLFLVAVLLTLLLQADAVFTRDSDYNKEQLTKIYRSFPILIVSFIGLGFLSNVWIMYIEGETYYKKATLGRSLFVSSENQNRWNSAAEMLGRSSYMQVPCLSVVTGCILGQHIDLLENLYTERKYFKLQLRVMQDIPDLIISIIDMYFFDLSVINIFDLVVSVLELCHYLAPFSPQIFGALLGVVCCPCAFVLYPFIILWEYRKPVWNCLKKLCEATAKGWIKMCEATAERWGKLCKATAERWRKLREATGQRWTGLQSKVIGGTPAEVYGRSAG